MADSSLSAFAFRPLVVALACGTGIQVAQAQSGQAPTQLPNIHVTSSGIKTDQSASVKLPVPLLDTPQTVTVVPKVVMEEQNVHSLKRVLANVPGITFDAGEGGGGSGDKPVVRGFSGYANMQVDGLRDSAQTTRSDLFNMESVEVTKGPNSVVGGAGTTGGGINLITKAPRAENFTEVSAGLGTDSYKRTTIDTNQVLGADQNVAVRLNLMVHDSDVAERDFIYRKRWGIAPSITFGLGTPTSATLSYLHQYDDNLPDYGLPALDGKPIPGIKRNQFYGWRNLDKERIDNDVVSLKLTHAFSDKVQLQNLTRWSQVKRNTVISAPHVNTAPVPPAPPVLPGNYLPAGPQAFARDATTEMWINQTHVSTELETGSFKHVLAAGFEISRETLDRDQYGLGASQHPPGGYDLYNPPGWYSGSLNKGNVTTVRSKLDTRALYAMDTISINPQWDVSLGLRYDWIRGDVTTDAFPEETTKKPSWRTGLVYKPSENGRIYVAYGTSFNPSAENLAVSGGFGNNNRTLGSQKSRTIELGTKWDLLEKRLGVTAALFRVDKTNVRETLIGDVIALVGEQRVQGLELGATGHITPQWDVYGAYTWMESENTRSRQYPERVGKDLPNTPRHAFNLWTGYTLPVGVKLSYGARYVGKRFNNPNAAGVRATYASYLTHSVMASYQIDRNLRVQLNVDNLTNKQYIEGVRGALGGATRSSALEYGDGRTVILSASYQF